MTNEGSSSLNKLEDRVSKIEQRNKMVELDKKWETSWTRRLTVGVLTYITVFLYLMFINNDSPYKNALVPFVGYILSTLVINWARSLWQK